MFTKLLDVTKLESIVIPDINLDSITENFIKSILNTLEKNSSLDNNLEILQARTAILLSANEVDNAKSGHLPDLRMLVIQNIYQKMKQQIMITMEKLW